MNKVVVLERGKSVFGEEIQLQQRERDFEIISNGVFLMSTENGQSEREMVKKAVAVMRRNPRQVLVGGLGVGHTADQVLREGDNVNAHIVEIEPKIVEWQYKYLYPFSNRVLQREGASLIIDDVSFWLERNPLCYDLICLDTDNGPDWIVADRNAKLYRNEGLDLLYHRVTQGGAVSFWSASRSQAFFQLLKEKFDRVYEYPVKVSATSQLPPDYVYIGCKD
ncbi:spermine/spermidine synthase [Alkalihalobacillus oceani]|uniref:spermine/spermidine synthase domain-containing protein n=1 Tax=Halalkalibacter oceani TaxID=1653776 RepID=UPI002041EBF4|nr:spermine/spermidine synthase [Halalkalibacter oceani]MCM3761711.1 spermine/spermidine synthase [Halalkalibacter oceani]